MARTSSIYPLLASLLLPTAGLADDPGAVRWCGQSPDAVAAEKDRASAPTGTGLRAFVDPKTGELIDEPPPDPAAVPAAPAEPQVAAPPEDLRVTVSSDGTESVELGDRFMTELRTEVIDGKLVTCHAPLGASKPTDVDARAPDREQGDERGNGH